MSADTIPHIFEPFFTTKGSKGTGLGLWISREIIDRNHGSLKVKSRRAAQGSGTVFTLFLPGGNQPS
jgi:signal transduction histidine kinase